MPKALPTLSLLCLILAACVLPTQPAPDASAAEIYALQLCANCHGDRGEGTSRGPALRALSTSWTRTDLADFLADPDGWEARDARLGALAKAHSGDMRSYDNLSPEQRLRLADWLLAL